MSKQKTINSYRTASNGNGSQQPAIRMPQTITLTEAQVRHMRRLVIAIDKAEWNIEEAQRQREHAQQTANNFLFFLAEDYGIQVGQDGWQFSQEEMRFFQIEDGDPANGND